MCLILVFDRDKYILPPIKGVSGRRWWLDYWFWNKADYSILIHATRYMIDITNYDTYSIMSIKIEEMDFVKTPKFSEVIHEKLEKIRYPNVILDLDNLYYIDSTGLSSLINISRKIKDNNNEMVVVCSSAKILQLFDIAKIGMFFRIFDSVDNAEKYIIARDKP